MHQLSSLFLRSVVAAAALAAVLAAVGLAPVPALAGPQIYSKIVPINKVYQGQTYGRWAAEWWQWALGIPGSKNPLVDLTGENCGERQVDDMFFLAGSFFTDPIVRDCTVPNGKSLFFPLLNSAWVQFLNDPPITEEELRALASCDLPVEISVEIDEVVLELDFTKFTTSESGSQSPIFTVQLGPDNVFGLGEDVIPELVFTPSAEEGNYLMLKPLGPGEHTIHFMATGCFAGFSQDITYNLTVEGEALTSLDSGPGHDRRERARAQTHVGRYGGLRVP